MSKRFSKACERNRQPIGDALADVLPDEGVVLEVGSGTGQHAVAFADRFPQITWQPADRPGRLDSIEARRDDADLDNLRRPLAFDLFDDRPPVDAADAIIAINVIHIAPEAAVERLFAHASNLLETGDPVILYGPYRYRGRNLESSNERFDRHLQARNPESGIRVFEDVDETARKHGFEHFETRRLPANNDIHWWLYRP